MSNKPSWRERAEKLLESAPEGRFIGPAGYDELADTNSKSKTLGQVAIAAGRF